MQTPQPPNWTPTGNSGTWFWDERGEYDRKAKKRIGCWKWRDDVHGYEWKKGLHGVMKGKKAGILEQGKKGWFERLKDIF
jgi:hypothetical protein